MKKTLFAFTLFLSGLLGAQAQTLPASESLYRGLGEKAGIARLMDNLVDRVAKDVRIQQHFKKTNLQNLKASLTDQVCQASGGPCVYKGPDMKTAHADMDVRKGDFNALVEDLQAAMDAQGIAFAQQNRLLAILAPMHRDVITVH